MYWKDRPDVRPLLQYLLGSIHIQVECVFFDIRKYRHSTEPRDFTGRREEGVGRREHFVTWLDTHSHDSQEQGVRTGGTSYCVSGPTVVCDVFLQPLHILAQNEFLRVHHPDNLG